MWDETGPAADAEPPPPVVTEPVFHRAISVSLRRDHAQLPVFRQTVKAHGGFAGLHMRRVRNDQQLADDYGGAGNNRAVSTATASSFLNGVLVTKAPGTALGRPVC